MVFGGGPGEIGLAFFAIALSGLALLVFALRGPGLLAFQAMPLLVRLAIAAAVALPFVQLIPLPPGLWQALPGHGLRIEVLRAFGLSDIWLPLSITPGETAYSAVIGLCMFGFFIELLGMSHDRMRAVVVCSVAVILFSIFFGVLQFTNLLPTLQFHKVAHTGDLIGFFANKNHMGLTIACLIPLTQILIGSKIHGNNNILILVAIFWLSLFTVIVATNSRAAVILGAAAMLLASFRLFPQHRKMVSLFAFGVVGAGAVAATLVPSISDIGERFGRAGDDGRFDILAQGMPLVEQYGFLGSGLGSFASVYAPTEKLEWVNRYYVNHLHNDWLQLVVEAGLPGVLVLLLGLGALALAGRAYLAVNRVSSKALATSKPNEHDYAWAGFVIILLFGLHSVADYPLRRVGALVIFVLALAFVFRQTIDKSRLTGTTR